MSVSLLPGFAQLLVLSCPAACLETQSPTGKGVVEAPGRLAEAGVRPPQAGAGGDALAEAREHFAEARTAHGEKDFPRARGSVARAVEVLLGGSAGELSIEADELLFELGVFAFEAGELQAAKRATTRVLEHRTAMLPGDHLALQSARGNLAVMIWALGDLAGARTLLEAQVEVLSRTVPADHPDLLAARGNLAIARKDLGDLEGARQLESEVLEILSCTLPDDHPHLQTARGNLAVTLKELGDLADARALEEEVLAVRSRTLPDDHHHLQAARGNLGSTLKSLGEFAAAHALFARAFEVSSRTRPDDHPELQTARTNLAVVLKALGDVAGARALEEKVLEVLSRTRPDDHPQLQNARENLALTLRHLGDLAGARELEERVLEVLSRTLPDDHGDLQDARLILATTLYLIGDRASARELFSKVLEVRSRTLPDDHPDLQVARQGLAVVLQESGDLAGASALEEEVLEVFSRTRPADDLALQRARMNHAVTLYLQGDFHGVRPVFEEVHEVLSRTLPDDHPTLQHSRDNLAATIACLDAELRPGDPRGETGGRSGRENGSTRFGELLQDSTRAFRRSAIAGIIDSSFREAEERICSRAGILAGILSLAEGYGVYAPDPAWTEQAFLASEVARSIVLAAARLERRTRTDPGLDDTRARAREGSSELARLARLGAGVEELAAARGRVEAAQRELLQAAGRASGEAAGELEPDLDVLARTVQEGEALVAYRRYRRSRLEGGDPPRERATDCLCAFVLRPGGRAASDGSGPTSETRGACFRLERVELGPIEPIEEAVERWRATLGTSANRGVHTGAAVEPSDPTRAGEEVRSLVLDPLAGALAGVGRVVVALDDVLHAVPFDALPAGTWWSAARRAASGHGLGETRDPEKGAPLGECLRIEPRSSLLELLVDTGAPSAEGGLLALGDVEFERVTEAATVQAAEEGAPLDVVQRSAAESGPLRGGAWERGFDALPATREEVWKIGRTYAEVVGDEAQVLVLSGEEASSEKLVSLAPKARFLHIATHGWFAPESIRSFVDPEPLDAHSGLAPRMSGEDRVRGMNPMLLCGLALAGANLPADATGRIPGLVTAEELSTLDLTGCELAVLSACDTNVGVRRAGQGVASLQRALHMAGARSVITSLWKVPDEATKELMVDFYRRIWVEKKPKAQALWEAKRELRGAKDDAGRPRYTTHDWAAWVLTGDPR